MHRSQQQQWGEGGGGNAAGGSSCGLEVLWMLNSNRKNPPASLPVIYSLKHGSGAAPPLLITGLISSCKRYRSVSGHVG